MAGCASPPPGPIATPSRGTVAPTATAVPSTEVATATPTDISTSTATAVPTVTATTASSPTGGVVQSPVPIPTPPDASTLLLRYHISIAESPPRARSAGVKIEVEQCSHPTLVFIVGWYYNLNDRRNFTANAAPSMSNLRAYDGSGDALSIRAVNSPELLESLGWHGSDAWELDMQGSSSATVEYEESLSSSYHALDLFPINQRVGAISVSFSLPNGWVPVTVWTPMGDFDFSVPATRKGVLGNFSVADIAIRPENEPVWSTTRDGTEILFFSEPWSPESMSYTLAVWSYLRSVHGGYPYDRYSFLGGGLYYLRQTSGWVASANQGWASTHSGLDCPLTYLRNSYACEKFGAHVTSGFHELSHSWNVDQFRGFGWDGEWYHDGIANYFEAIGPRDAFDLDRVYRAWLYQAWDFYQGKTSSEYDVPLIELDSLWNKPDLDWTLMKYFKGALFFYMLDQQFLTAGNNFYDFTAYLYQDFRPDSNPGTVEELMQAAEMFAGQDLTDFFNAYLLGNERYPLQELDAYRADYEEVFGSHPCEARSGGQ